MERVSRSHGKCYFRTAGDERRGQEFPQHPAQGDHDRVVRYWRLPLSDDDALRTRDVIFQCLGTHACGLFIHSGHQFIHRIAPHFQIQLGDVAAVRQLDLQEPRVAPAILEQAHCTPKTSLSGGTNATSLRGSWTGKPEASQSCAVRDLSAALGRGYESPDLVPAAARRPRPQDRPGGPSALTALPPKGAPATSFVRGGGESAVQGVLERRSGFELQYRCQEDTQAMSWALQSRACAPKVESAYRHPLACDRECGIPASELADIVVLGRRRPVRAHSR
jgi:hypothetical protein